MYLDRRRTRGGFTTKTAAYSNFTHGGSPTYYSVNYKEGVWEFFEDVDKPYGSGVWPMSPMFRGRVALAVTPAMFPCRICKNTWMSHAGPYIFTGEGILTDQWTDTTVANDRHPDVVVLPADVRSELAGRAEASLPHLYKGLPNLVRLLAELKDVGATIKSVAQTLDLLASSVRLPRAALSATLQQLQNEYPNWRNMARAFRVKDLGTSTVKVIAGDALAYKFAIAPYVKDVRKLYSKSASVLTHIEQLRKGLGKVHTLKVRASRSTSERTVVDGAGRCASGCPGCPMNCYVSSVEPPTHQIKEERSAQHAVLTLKYTYDIPVWAKGIISESEALLRYATAGLNSKTVWELLPFSFVLEWFLNTKPLLSGNVLGLNEDLAKDCVVNIVDAALTYQIEDGITCETGRFARGLTMTETGTRKYVYRWVGDQALNHLAWVLKLPGFAQWALGAAMAAGSSHVYS